MANGDQVPGDPGTFSDWLQSILQMGSVGRGQATGKTPGYFNTQANQNVAAALAIAHSDPMLAAHILASMGPPPAGMTPRTQEDAGPSPAAQGTTVSPAQQAPLAAGNVTGQTSPPQYPSSAALSGSSGGPGMADPPLPMLRPQSDTSPDSASVRDTSTAHIPGEAAGLQGGGAWGAGVPDTTATGTQAGDQAAKIGEALKALGAIKMPEDKYQPISPPALPQITHRFSPADLLAMVGDLSTPAQKLAAPLGALIGGQR